jgi:hypothetical protein
MQAAPTKTPDILTADFADEYRIPDNSHLRHLT